MQLGVIGHFGRLKRNKSAGTAYILPACFPEISPEIFPESFPEFLPDNLRRLGYSEHLRLKGMLFAKT